MVIGWLIAVDLIGMGLAERTTHCLILLVQLRDQVTYVSRVMSHLWRGQVSIHDLTLNEEP